MAVVTDTVEVRWFLTGPPPEVVSDWFLHGPVPAIIESRTDLYLDLADRDDVGAKVRAGTLLELKFRTGVHAELGLAEGFDGRVESWTKWGFALDPAETGTGWGDPRWIQVEKKRRTRLYEVATDGGSSPPGTPVPWERALGLPLEGGYGLARIGSSVRDPYRVLRRDPPGHRHPPLWTRWLNLALWSSSCPPDQSSPLGTHPRPTPLPCGRPCTRALWRSR